MPGSSRFRPPTEACGTPAVRFLRADYVAPHITETCSRRFRASTRPSEPSFVGACQEFHKLPRPHFSEGRWNSDPGSGACNPRHHARRAVRRALHAWSASMDNARLLEARSGGSRLGRAPASMMESWFGCSCRWTDTRQLRQSSLLRFVRRTSVSGHEVGLTGRHPTFGSVPPVAEGTESLMLGKIK